MWTFCDAMVKDQITDLSLDLVSRKPSWTLVTCKFHLSIPESVKFRPSWNLKPFNHRMMDSDTLGRCQVVNRFIRVCSLVRRELIRQALINRSQDILSYLQMSKCCFRVWIWSLSWTWMNFFLSFGIIEEISTHCTLLGPQTIIVVPPSSRHTVPHCCFTRCVTSRFSSSKFHPFICLYN